MERPPARPVDDLLDLDVLACEMALPSGQPVAATAEADVAVPRRAMRRRPLGAALRKVISGLKISTSGRRT